MAEQITYNTIAFITIVFVTSTETKIEEEENLMITKTVDTSTFIA